MVAIELKNVGECFSVYPYGRAALKDHLLRPLRTRKRRAKSFWALRGIDLTVRKGEVVGIIGENGCGKTTLLRLISGILHPDEGSLRVRGRVAALLDLGVAFHRDLSGRENVYLYGAMLGLTKAHIDRRFAELVTYAGLERFIDLPLRTYSSGMAMRLGFALAINVDPDILLVDEVFVVGDQAFQRQCLGQIDAFRSRGKTIVLVSHDMGLISSLCERTVLLREGAIAKTGPTDEVIRFYAQSMGEKRGVAIAGCGSTNLIFNNGRCSLFWRDVELTKKLGMFSSFLADGRWYTSAADAVWEVLEKDRARMVVQGTWKRLPVRERWSIDLAHDDVIHWTIENTVERPARLEREHVGVMVSDAYRRWSAVGEEGDFPCEFDKRMGGWEVLWAARSYSEPACVALRPDERPGIPTLSLSCRKAGDDVTTIENSDELFQGRVVQYSKIRTDQKPGGESGGGAPLSLTIRIGSRDRDSSDRT